MENRVQIADCHSRAKRLRTNGFRYRLVRSPRISDNLFSLRHGLANDFLPEKTGRSCEPNYHGLILNHEWILVALSPPLRCGGTKVGQTRGERLLATADRPVNTYP